MLACLLILLGASPPVEVTRSERHDISPPLRTLPLLPPRPVPVHEEPAEQLLRPLAPLFDPVRQRSALMSPGTPLVSFEGIGPGTGFLRNANPPDANGDVGPDHYVQATNFMFAVFSKSGSLVYGPAATRTLFQGFGGGCEQVDSGDPQVVYDGFADRWLIHYISKNAPDGVDRQCVAVSSGPDPTGAWFRYAFGFSRDGPDYGKIGVWPPASYVFTTTLANVSIATACAFHRERMLAGLDAAGQCFTLPFDGPPRDGRNEYPVPADVDGPRPPPQGADAYLLTVPLFGEFGVFRLHVDWADASKSFLSPRKSAPIAPLTHPCGACIEQPGTTQRLPSASLSLRHRLAYRNFGDHEALVTAQAADASGTVAIRWYELRPDGSGGLVVHDQGTFAPDAHHRFVPSVAMDGQGNLAVGYSVSSNTVYPSIRYAGRLAGDPPGTLTIGEGTLIEGTESLTFGNRWGDYSAMQVDPIDDSTFWFTTEYVSRGAVATRIGAFRWSRTPPPDAGTAPDAGTTLDAGAGSDGGSMPDGGQTSTPPMTTPSRGGCMTFASPLDPLVWMALALWARRQKRSPRAPATTSSSR